MTFVELPNNWQIKTLGEVCETTSGGTPSRGNKSYYNGTIPWVKSGELNKGIIYDTEEKITEEAIKNSSAKIFPKGTLLIALYGATIGKLAFLGVDAATNQAVCGIYQNDAIESKYLYNFLFHKKQDLVKQGIGGAQPNISQTILKKLEIPLPNLETQQAIVSKIEELFSELDKGIEDLKTAQQQLKTYQQSVLKWAFEGKLTNENVKDGELPKGWELKTLGELGKWKGGGTPSKQNKSFWENGTNLWVSSKDMKCKNINDSIDKITDDAIVKSSAKIISKGAIMFVMRSGILRHTLPVAIAGKELTVNQDLQSVEPYEFIDSEYLYWYIIGKNQKIRQECSKDGTTVESIDTTSLKKYNIPIAPIKEQHLIVQEIESRLSVADKMEESIAQSLQQAEALRQSILKKAFSGELV